MNTKETARIAAENAFDSITIEQWWEWVQETAKTNITVREAMWAIEREWIEDHMRRNAGN